MIAQLESGEEQRRRSGRRCFRRRKTSCSRETSIAPRRLANTASGAGDHSPTDICGATAGAFVLSAVQSEALAIGVRVLDNVYESKRRTWRRLHECRLSSLMKRWSWGWC